MNYSNWLSVYYDKRQESNWARIKCVKGSELVLTSNSGRD